LNGSGDPIYEMTRAPVRQWLNCQRAGRSAAVIKQLT
jgi:hypothetical protein